jgi:small-conductance mechanosensitive channel
MIKETVRKHMNRRTKIVGLVGIVFYMCVGYFLKFMNMYYYADWKRNYDLLNHHLEAAHVHGILLSFMLLFYSFFVEVSALDGRWRRIGANLAIGGSVLMPLTPVTAKAPAFFGVGCALVSHLGVIMILAAMVILAWGHIKSVPCEQRTKA